MNDLFLASREDYSPSDENGWMPANCPFLEFKPAGKVLHSDCTFSQTSWIRTLYILAQGNVWFFLGQCGEASHPLEVFTSERVKKRDVWEEVLEGPGYSHFKSQGRALDLSWKKGEGRREGEIKGGKVQESSSGF